MVVSIEPDDARVVEERDAPFDVRRHVDPAELRAEGALQRRRLGEQQSHVEPHLTQRSGDLAADPTTSDGDGGRLGVDWAADLISPASAAVRR